MNKLSFIMAVLLMVAFANTFSSISFSQNAILGNEARDIFDNKTLTLPSNVKNFVILIPNEAHESPLLPKEQRLINQPYVPQNLVSGANTQIIWFTGDVGHTREITLTDENSKEAFNSRLKFNTATEPLLLNHSGKFTYFEENANMEDPKFVMEGSIKITNGDVPPNSNDDVTASDSPFDTMLVLMVPTNDIKKHMMTIVDNKVNIIDIYSFKDLRETGGGGANQTLLVLGTNDPLDETISVLKKITSTLPYS
ncbi:MAG TPA: hypothetical protein VK566_00495 [Nitrososphaeraceae archaeon]|nr:hypothetical protein [Nitrososphaeraceae archaeon]